MGLCQPWLISARDTWLSLLQTPLCHYCFRDRWVDDQIPRFFANVANSFDANWGPLSLIIWSGIPQRAKWLFSFSITVLALVYLPKVAIVIDVNQIFFTIQGKDIGADPLPWARRGPNDSSGCEVVSSSLLFCMPSSMYCLISADIPDQYMGSQALLRHDSVSRWKEWILAFMSARRLLGITTALALKINLSWSVNLHIKVRMSQFWCNVKFLI